MKVEDKEKDKVKDKVLNIRKPQLSKIKKTMLTTLRTSKFIKKTINIMTVRLRNNLTIKSILKKDKPNAHKLSIV